MKQALIVEDSPVTRKIEARILSDIGFDTLEAENGQEALLLLRALSKKPSFILLDWNMPIMDGMEFIKELKKYSDFQNIPVVFCTTETDVSNIVKALEAGATEYIMKPFTKEIIFDKLTLAGLI